MSVQGSGSGNSSANPVALSDPSYAASPSKPSWWLTITYKLNSARYLLGPWFWAGASIYTLWLFTKFVIAVENSHLIIGLVD